jgi:hypothetical protein
MNTGHRPVVHLVGSIPLADTADVFRAASRAVGSHLLRLPDGETGDRLAWAGFVGRKLADNPAFEIDPDYPSFDWFDEDGDLVATMEQHRFRPGVDPGKVTFDIGYAPLAIESFTIFDRMQKAGEIPAGVKFQVSLPTPMAISFNSISPRYQEAFQAAYEPQLIGEAIAIADAIPHDRLAFQWDVCQEVLVWEKSYPVIPPNYKELVLAELQRLGDAIPADVDLGYHLCYGSPRGKHLVRPKDTGVMVEMLNGLFARLGRGVQFIHIPVPRDRTDEAYFKPLESLKLPAGCDLYLGLIHYRDEAGDRRRLEAARRHTRVDGISCECGWGRDDPAHVPDLMASHARAIGYL